MNGEPHQSGFVLEFHLAPHTLRLTMEDALCDILGWTMPAIASIEDLRAAQKEGFSIYAMHYLSSKAETTASEDALCSMLYEDGAG